MVFVGSRALAAPGCLGLPRLANPAASSNLKELAVRCPRPPREHLGKSYLQSMQRLKPAPFPAKPFQGVQLPMAAFTMRGGSKTTSGHIVDVAEPGKISCLA